MARDNEMLEELLRLNLKQSRRREMPVNVFKLLLVVFLAFIIGVYVGAFFYFGVGHVIGLVP